MLFRANQAIPISEARELLGDESDSMTDEEVLRLIEDFDIIAQYTIKLVQKFKQNKATTG
jgi:hypothetical protein